MGPELGSAARSQEEDGMSVSTVAELLRRLEGLEQRPLAEQVTLLEETRRGLDQVLAGATVEHPATHVDGDHPRSAGRG